MDDRAAIAEANRNFYRAMRAQDMRLMEHVWLRADWVGCVHPGGPLIVGWRAVRESWLYIMARGAVNVLPTQVTIHVERDLAWVTCVENISVPAEKLWRNTLTQATNLFQRSGDEWRMIHHHASPLAETGTGQTPLS